LMFTLCGIWLLGVVHHVHAADGLFVASVAHAHTTPFNNGVYRAIIIGNNEYKDSKNIWGRLNTAVSDASSVAKLLKDEYGFEDVNLLLNATRRQILGALSGIASKSQANDNILIYYAGHGYRNEDTDEAYWIPVDAQGWDDSYFLSNARIKEKLSVISARAGHTLLVSDSCFSGSLLRGGNRGISLAQRNEPYLRKVAKRKSVQIVAAGGLEFVDDDYRRSGHSPFTYFFLHELRDNTDELLTTTELSTSLTRQVGNNVQQTPQSGVLHGAGDEGGEFIFRRTKISIPEPQGGGRISGSKTVPPGFTVNPQAIEFSYWQSIKDSNNPALFSSYLSRYPKGTFVDIAKHKLKILQAPKKAKPDLAELLAQAERYFKQGDLIEPTNKNAREQWRSVLALDPANRQAKNGLTRISERLVSKANTDMKNHRLSSAAKYLELAEETQPGLSITRSAKKRLQRIEKGQRQKTPEKTQMVIPPPSF